MSATGLFGDEMSRGRRWRSKAAPGWFVGTIEAQARVECGSARARQGWQWVCSPLPARGCNSTVEFSLCKISFVHFSKKQQQKKQSSSGWHVHKMKMPQLLASKWWMTFQFTLNFILKLTGKSTTSADQRLSSAFSSTNCIQWGWTDWIRWCCRVQFECVLLRSSACERVCWCLSKREREREKVEVDQKSSEATTLLPA